MKTGIGRLKKALETRRQELLLALRQRDGIHLEVRGDDLEKLRVAAEREVAISNLTRESSLLRDVVAALRRIEDNTFGTCESCGKQIPARRLQAVPWAACCVDCQAATEQKSTDADSPEHIRLHAA